MRSAPLSALYVSLDLKNLVFHDSGRHLNLNDIVGVCTDQCFTYRRLIGDLSLKAVSLCGTYDLQLHIFLKFIIMNLNLAAYADSVKIDFVLYYNLSVLEDLLDLLDTYLDISLLILCCIVLCVLRKVSLLSGLFDLSCYFFSLNNFQIVQLIFQFSEICKKSRAKSQISTRLFYIILPGLIPYFFSGKRSL